MSRYSLKPLPHRADLFEVAVGWDLGLGTYFAIVFGTPEIACEPEVLLWRGRTFREIYSLAELIDIIREFAEVAPELRCRLAADQGAEPLKKGS